jgi:hypothetical protein
MRRVLLDMHVHNGYLLRVGMKRSILEGVRCYANIPYLAGKTEELSDKLVQERLPQE